MNNYVVGADGVNREIPGVFEESFQNDVIMPSRVSDGSYQYDTDYGSMQIGAFRTRGKADSNKKFYELYGYLKGRGWVSERVVLARNGGEIQAYLRIDNTSTDFRGSIKTKRSMDIKVYQKF